MVSIVIDIDKETEEIVAREAALRGVSVQVMAAACFQSGFQDVIGDDDDDIVSPELAGELNRIFEEMDEGTFYTAKQVREHLGVA